jgi:hypothetical protein
MSGAVKSESRKKRWLVAAAKAGEAKLGAALECSEMWDFPKKRTPEKAAAEGHCRRTPVVTAKGEGLMPSATPESTERPKAQTGADRKRRLAGESPLGSAA